MSIHSNSLIHTFDTAIESIRCSLAFKHIFAFNLIQINGFPFCSMGDPYLRKPRKLYNFSLSIIESYFEKMLMRIRISVYKIKCSNSTINNHNHIIYIYILARVPRGNIPKTNGKFIGLSIYYDILFILKRMVAQEILIIIM